MFVGFSFFISFIFNLYAQLPSTVPCLFLGRTLRLGHTMQYFMRHRMQHRAQKCVSTSIIFVLLTVRLLSLHFGNAACDVTRNNPGGGNMVQLVFSFEAAHEVAVMSHEVSHRLSRALNPGGRGNPGVKETGSLREAGKEGRGKRNAHRGGSGKK